VSGKRVRFIGDAMAAVVQGVEEVRTLIGQSPVVVGGLAVMCRLSDPYRATTDLDVVDRLLGEVPQLAADIALHVDLWLIARRRQALRWIHDAGGTDLTLDDLDLVAELLLAVCAQS
jgi:hypothetical protein